MRLLSVLILELSRTARRERTYWLRTVYVAFLATFVALNWMRLGSGAEWGAQQTRIGRVLFADFAFAQFILINLAAPVFLCAAINEERRRGTLPVLLSTQLSAMEIAFGKLVGGLIPIGLLLAAGIPILFLLLVFGGLGPAEVVAAFGLTLVCAMVGASAALFFSTLTRSPITSLGLALLVHFAFSVLPGALLQDHRAIFSTGGGLSGRFPWEVVSPYLGFVWVFSARDADELWWVVPGALMGLAVCGTFLLLTAVPLRWNEARGGSLIASLPGRSKRRAGSDFSARPEKATDWTQGNPVLLRETGGAWSAVRRGGRTALWMTAAVTIVVLVLAGRFFPVDAQAVTAHEWALPLLLLLTMTLPLLGGAQAFTRESEGHALELLLSTPMSGASLVQGKLAVIFLPFLPVATVPLLYALAFISAGSLHGVVAAQVLGVQLAGGAWVGVVALACGVLVRKRGQAVGLACLLLLVAEGVALGLGLGAEMLGVLKNPERALLVVWFLPIRAGDVSLVLGRDFILCLMGHLVAAGGGGLLLRHTLNRALGRCS